MFDEYMKGLEKKLCKLEEEITGKKQRKYIRDFKDYQAGRILTFQRKYDHMYESSTDVEVRNTERIKGKLKPLFHLKDTTYGCSISSLLWRQYNVQCQCVAIA
ncbi:hypothetical protein NDU88_003849 [Pleurodeles waltl]|uniref:Uncharacterized protein n=1 Tax=Pleurodeles waltl TaxID=8319 RepID=A0AAV7LGN2_PLEWA|nr:hypothetical protein NDU88_003849 [Pleurodeles waltl]